jgi:hypothetical protein
MTEMMPISEAERQLAEQRAALTAEAQAINSERQKYVSKSETLGEKIVASQRESNAALHRLRHLLASLSTYIEARDVTYEYKKGVGLAQTVVQYKGIFVWCIADCASFICLQTILWRRRS